MNVSSVVWSRDDLEEGLEALGHELTDFKLVGDWRLYLQVLLTPGRDQSVAQYASQTSAKCDACARS